jgi:hypothetical protein
VVIQKPDSTLFERSLSSGGKKVNGETIGSGKYIQQPVMQTALSARSFQHHRQHLIMMGFAPGETSRELKFTRTLWKSKNGFTSLRGSLAEENDM